MRLPATRLIAPARAAPAGGCSDEAESPLAGITILVVDDEPDVRDILVCVLDDAGATVLAAADVDGALSALASQPIDVLVTDLVMPGQDGYDLLARIGRPGSAPRPRTIIAVTALASTRERLRAIAAGFDHHVVKPVNFDALLELIVESSNCKVAR